MVVLINQFSASASEVLSGAIRDHGRGQVVGTTSFGKGSVNTLRPLEDGSGVYVSIARWYTPSGSLIEGVGITPDVFVEGTPGYPDLSLSGQVDRENDAQLLEALERLARNRVMHSNAQ